MQPQAHDPDVLWQAVLDIMVEAGHSHLLPELEDYATDEGSEVDDIDTPPMSPSRRVIIETAQKMQPEPQGPTVEELLNPTGQRAFHHGNMQWRHLPSSLPLLGAVRRQYLAGRWMPAAT